MTGVTSGAETIHPFWSISGAEIAALPDYLSSPPVLVGFVLLDL